MKILIACEFSGIVRDEFKKHNHLVISCDLIRSEKPGRHYHGNVLDIINLSWDMIIAFPPCTHLCSSGARWFKDKQKDGRQQQGVDFFMKFVNNKCNKIAIENPIGIMSTKWRKPDQIIQPWQFGHGETKATCLWLKGLPQLKPTNIVNGRENRIHKMAPSKDRSKNRSRTYLGIAKAMAEQWT